MNNSGLNNKYIYSALLLLIPFMQLIGQTEIKPIKETFYNSVFKNEIVKLDANQTNEIKKQVLQDLNQLNKWKSLTLKDKVKTFFIPYTSTERILKELYLSQSNAVGVINADQTIAFLNKKINDLNELKELLKKTENEINTTLYPFKNDETTADNVKIGFVNSFDYLIRTIKFMSYESDNLEGNIAYFNAAKIPKDTISFISDVFKNSILKKISTKSDEDYNTNSVLSKLKECKNLSDYELITKLNSIGNKFLISRQKLFNDKIENNGDIIKILKKLNLNSENIIREELVEDLRQLYYDYRVFVRELSGATSDIDKNTLTDIKLDPKYKDIDKYLRPIINKDLTFFEIISKLNNQSITTFDYSEKTVIYRMLNNAFSSPLVSLIDSINLETTSINNLPTINENNHLSKEIESFIIARVEDLSQVFKPVIVHNYKIEKNTFELKIVPNKVLLNMSGNKLEYEINTSANLNWNRNDRSSEGQILDLGTIEGKLDFKNIDKINVQDYIKLFESKKNIIDSIATQFKLPILSKLNIKSIQFEYAEIIINSSNKIDVNFDKILDLIANGNLSDSMTNLALQYFNKIITEEGPTFLSKINDSILKLRKTIDPSSTLEDYLTLDIFSKIQKENIQINKSSFECEIPIYYRNNQSKLLGNIYLAIPFSDPKSTMPKVSINKGQLFNVFMDNFNSLVLFKDVTIHESLYTSSVYLKTQNNSSTYLGELKFDTKSNDPPIFNLEAKDQNFTIGGTQLNLQNLSYDSKSEIFKGQIKLISSDFDLFLNRKDYDNSLLDLIIDQTGISIVLEKSNNLIIKSNEYLIKNNLLKATNKIESIIISNNKTEVILENSTYDINNFINSLVKEKLHLLSKNINDFIANATPNPLFSNEQIELKLKNNDSLKLYIKTISKDYAVVITKKNEFPIYSLNQNLKNRIESNLNSILKETIDLKSENLIIDYDINKSKFKVDISLDANIITTWIDLEGNVIFDKESIKTLAKNTALNLGLEDIKNDINTWLKERLKLIKPKYFDINVIANQETFNNGKYILELKIKDFINKDENKLFLGLNNVLVSRINTNDLKFDFTNVVVDTEHIKNILSNTFDNNNIEIQGVDYINSLNEIGIIHLSSVVSIPYINYKTPVDFNLDLKSFDSKIDVSFDNGIIAREIFKALKQEHFDNNLKNKTFSLSELELTIKDMKVLKKRDSLQITTDIKIPSININAPLTLLIDKDFKIHSEPSDIGQLLAQQALNQLTDKAFSEVKKLFPLLEDYVTIDSVTPIRKLNKGINLSIPNGIRIESSAKIYELFEVSLPPLLITSNGVEIEGPKSVKFVYNTPIPIPPIFFLKDIGGILSKKELKGEAKFVAGEENLIKIDGTFRVPFEGDSRIYLEGDLILFNNFNLASSDSYININKAQFKSTLETSKSFSSLFYFKLNTDIKAKGNDWYAEADGEMKVFEVFKGEANATFDKNHFHALFTLNATPIPLFPSSQVELKAGKMFSNPEISTQTKVSIKGHDIAGVKGTIASNHSSLDFNFLGMNLGATVPSYKDLDDELIWELIKNLLNPDFKNLDKALMALLQGNININPFSGFGSGGDGVAANGNSSGGDGGTGGGGNKGPYKNGNSGAKTEQGGTMGYADIAAEVKKKDFEKTWVGTSTSIKKSPNSSTTEITKSNPKENLKEFTVNTLNPVANGSVDLFKKIADNKYSAYKFGKEIDKNTHLENLEIDNSLFQPNNDGYYNFNPTVNTIASYNGKLAFIYEEKLYLYTKKQTTPIKFKLEDLNWGNFKDKNFNKSPAYTKMMCALNEVFCSNCKLILDETNPKREGDNVIFFINNPLINNPLTSKNKYKIIGVVNNECILISSNGSQFIAEGLTENLPKSSTPGNIINLILKKYEKEKSTCCD